MTETATVTITSQTLANPIVFEISKAASPLPVPASAKFVATSPEGQLVETVTMEATVDGFEIVPTRQVAAFPLNIGGTFGPYFSEVVKALNATITLDVVNA